MIYHKIQTVYKRDPDNKTLIDGEYSRPEFEYLADLDWECTEKIDGTNIRVYFDGSQFYFRGRSDKSKIPGHLMARLEEIFAPSVGIARERFGEDANVCLYGEGCGPKIQAGGERYGDTPMFILFDVAVDGVYLDRRSVEDVAVYLGLDVSPVIFVGPLPKMVDYVRDGVMSVFRKGLAEGLVSRPIVEMQTRCGERIITKLKHRDFR